MTNKRKEKAIKMALAIVATLSMSVTAASLRRFEKQKYIEVYCIPNAIAVAPQAERLDVIKAVKAISREFNVPSDIVMAVISQESSFREDARNGDCYGLMQVHRVNFAECEAALAKYGVVDIKGNPVDNIFAGTYLLSKLQEKYGEWNKVLMAYNAGETGAKRQWAKGIKSTAYSREIIKNREVYRSGI